jgi:A/G-specific adenine glycosylase
LLDKPLLAWPATTTPRQAIRRTGLTRAEVRRSQAGITRKALLRKWFKSHGRKYPWRHFRSPWQVLLAEMLLLRTRADFVAGRIVDVVQRFPTVQAMADAKVTVVEGALHEFGLRWRARHLHRLAGLLVTRHQGQVPLELDALMRLPGVGPYIASATLSTVIGRKVLLTDANTVRVAKRVAGLSLEGDVRRRKDVQMAIGCLLGGPSAATDWLAVLDLAAKVCTAKNPHCEVCPIRRLCAYRSATWRPAISL